MPKTDEEKETLWQEIIDLMIECADERSKAKWLASALEKPEYEILEALRHGEAKGEVRAFPNDFWRLI